MNPGCSLFVAEDAGRGDTVFGDEHSTPSTLEPPNLPAGRYASDARSGHGAGQPPLPLLRQLGHRVGPRNPFSRPGGFTIESNLVAACVYCNRSKGGRTPDEWRRAQAVERLSQALAHRRTRRGRIEAVIRERAVSRSPA